MTNYDDEFKDAFSDADKKFKEMYQRAIDDLKGFSQEELDEIAPSTTDKKVYDLLIGVVEDASQKNIQVAELKNRIENFSKTALHIVDKIPSLRDLIK